MPTHRIADAEPFVDNVSDEDRDKCVLGLLIDESPWPWTVQELGCELETNRGAEDSVDRLSRAGLLHRLGPFVFPTRAARRAEEIEAGTV
ncbi:MAG: hypothetical protein ACTHM1_00810 [Solirubrobacteraceae bacterium]